MKTLYHKNKFKFRLLISFTIFFICITAIISYLFYTLSYQNAKDNELSSSHMVVERISTQFEALYNQIDIAATSITKNPSLKQIVLNLNTGSELPEPDEQRLTRLQTKRTVDSLLTNMMFSSNISNVLLYDKEKSYFYYTGLYLGSQNDTLLKLQNSTSPSGDGQTDTDTLRIYDGPHLSPWTDEEKIVLSVRRNFDDITTTKTTIVEIQVPYSHLKDICEQNTFAGEKEILILDKDSNIVYPYSQKVSVLPMETITDIVRQTGQGQTSGFEKAYFYHSIPILDNNFQVVLLSNNQSLDRFEKENKTTTFLTFAILLLSSLLLMFTIISVISRPLKELIDYINQISLEKDTQLVLPNNTLDEFQLINTSFNQMLDKMRESVKQTYEAKIRETNANLTALQAQINPHFLYNALGSISAASEVYGSEMTTRMCQEFSSMMRYITSSKQKIKLIEEIEHTKNYLDFMKLSYDGTFDYEISVPLNLYNLIFPKLIIQPLVENSFKHGFKETEPPWFIRIRGYTQEQSWFLEITDNGSGFSLQSMDAFLQFKKQYQDENTLHLYENLEIGGLGLKNIWGRLMIFFDKNIDLSISSQSSGCLILLKGVFQDD